MKIIKRILKKKNVFLYSLFFIPIIIFLIQNKEVENDLWFLLNSGRYVLENGIPHIEPFTIHANMAFTMPQWLSAVIFFFIYNNFGILGLHLLVILIGILILILFYKLNMEISKNKIISIISTTIFGVLLQKYIITRPQIFTYLILLIELLCLEKYTKKSEIKYLIILPFLSILEINLHASMWMMLHLFLLPYILNGIKIKKFNLNVNSYKIQPLLFTMLIMIVVGLINPYSYKSIIYIFTSSDINKVSDMIKELNQIDITQITGMIFYFCIFILLFIINFNKKNKLNLRMYLLLIGTTFLTISHIKCWPYFMIVYFLALTYLLNINLENIKIKKKYIKILFNSTLVIASLIISGIFMYNSYQTFNHLKDVKEDNMIKDTVDFMEENYNLNEIRLFVDYNHGGYTEYRGIRTYIDPRAEVFIKNNNNKDDILLEYYELTNSKDFNYYRFLRKYNFTHLLVNCYEEFDSYLAANENYELIYTQQYENFNIMNLYVKK